MVLLLPSIYYSVLSFRSVFGFTLVILHYLTLFIYEIPYKVAFISYMLHNTLFENVSQITAN